MTEPLYRLIYFSRNLIPGNEAEVEAHIRDILRVSRENNGLARITGALMFNLGCFAQVLEGPRHELEARFERIQQDERHGDVILLSLEATSERAFPNWSMAFFGANYRALSLYADIGAESGFDPARMTAHELLAVLKAQLAEGETAGI